MIIEVQARSAHHSIKALARVTKILGEIRGDTFSINTASGIVLQSKMPWWTFTALTRKFGLVEVAEESAGTKSAVYRKTGIVAEIVTIKNEQKPKPVKEKVVKEAKPKNPARGDGSVLNPQFNHSIAPPIPRNDLKHRDTFGVTRLKIMAKIDDCGGYDYQSKLGRLEELRAQRNG